MPIPFAFVGYRCGWASFLGDLDCERLLVGVYWRWLFGLASFCGLRVVDDVRCQAVLPLTGGGVSLSSFSGFIASERYGSFSLFKNLIGGITLVQARGSVEFTSLS